MEHIAKIRTGFPAKFGIPRQSGLIESDKAEIVFCGKYRNPDSLRGLEGFSHIWLIWEFSESVDNCGEWSPTVRPPRLGGNTRMGVFATRSPFRPNPIGLSCVRLERIETHTPEGPVLHVSGADLMDGTPIYDIKPYIPFTDCRPDATGGYTDLTRKERLNVTIPQEIVESFPEEFISTINEILAQGPQPRYRNDSQRLYGFQYRNHEIRFTVSDNNITVNSIEAIVLPERGIQDT